MEALSPDRRLAGRYVLEAPIASGGMATVWRARDEVLARMVAVKVLRSDLADDPILAERFHREALAAARLSHPGVVAVYDTGVDRCGPFIVMELADGRTLADIVAGRAPLEPDLAIASVLPVLAALEYAHANQVIHRDVKPANVLVDDDGRIRMTDFGIAKATSDDRSLTLSGQVLGTARYLAPEQVRSEPVDARTDVYAVGVILYELLTGRAPFDAETPVGTAMARLGHDPVPPRDLRPQIERALEAVVLKALARSPSDRYRSAAEMRTALERLLTNEADTAPLVPVGAVRHVRRDTQTTTPARGTWFRSWMLVPLLVLVVAAGVIAAGLAVGRLRLGGPLGVRAAAPSPLVSTAPTLALRPIQVSGIQDVDPEGSPPSENPGEAALAADGDPNTAWFTEHYSTAHFGQLKDGLGLFVELGGSVRVTRVIIASPLGGWSFQLKAGSSAEAAGKPLRATTGETTFHVDQNGTATVLLRGVRTSGVLVWITSLGADRGGFAGAIGEVTVEGPG